MFSQVMGKSEPSFVPEWLKGNGDYSNLTTCGSDSKDHQVCPRKPDSSHYLQSRRSLKNNTNLTAGKDTAPESRFYPTLKYDHIGRDHKYGQNRDRESFQGRDRTSGFCSGEGLSDCLDKSLSWKHNLTAFDQHSLDISIKQMVLLGSLNKGLKNGMPRVAADSGVFLEGTVLGDGHPQNNIRKAAFEKDFPLLRSQEKPVPLQSCFSGGSAVNVQPFRQGSSFECDDGCSSSLVLPTSMPSSISATASGSTAVEGWRTISTEAPVSSGNLLRNNGLVFSGQVLQLQATADSLTTPVVVHQQGVPKMAEALLQNQTQVPSPAQHLMESQRLEELALRQSRQLIPMKPSLPKTFGLSTRNRSTRDKPNSKIGRGLDAPMITAPKTNVSNNPSVRASTTMHSETSKHVMPKTSKDGSMPSFIKKFDVNGSLLVTSSSNSGVGAISSLTVLSRKTKQLLDTRETAVTNIALTSDNGITPRTKDGLPVGEDKRLPSQAQNRSDFFNVLRRKAAESSGVKSNKVGMSEGLLKRIEAGSSKEACEIESCTFPLPKESDESLAKEKEKVASCIGGQGNNQLDNSSCNESSISATRIVMEGTSMVKNSCNEALCTISIACGSEEEETKFLRSLGWVDIPDDGDEALTEDEINAFLRQCVSIMSSRGLNSQCRSRLQRLGEYRDKVVSLGNALLDTELDAQSCTQQSKAVQGMKEAWMMKSH